MITINEFLNFTIKNISQVYVGKDNHCRCGCGGDYTATSYMIEPRSDVNDNLVEKRLKRAKRLIESGAEYQLYNRYINIESGNNRALTLYFDEVAK
jgi:hypothetical protein